MEGGINRGGIVRYDVFSANGSPELLSAFQKGLGLL